MKIDKTGFYRTRGGKIVTVEGLTNPTWPDELYPIHGYRDVSTGTQLTAWDMSGNYIDANATHVLDLIEYLRAEDYPELYI